MRDVWAVIRREYLQRVRSRWFAFSTVAGPLVLLLAVAGPTWLTSRRQQAESRIAVVDLTGVLAEPVARRMEEAGLSVALALAADLDDLRRRTLAGELGGVLVLDPETAVSGRARLIARESPSLLRRMTVMGAVAQGALEARLEGRGADVGALLAGGDLDVELLGEGGGFEDPAFASAWVGAFVLYVVTLLYAVAVMRAVLEEKTSRVVEIIVSSVRPFHLMLGKILGVGSVGLTQLGVWALALLATFSLVLPAVMASRPGLAQLAVLQDFAPRPGYLGLFLVFFLGGYFMYAGLYAAVGAMCNSDEEAQYAQLPLVVIFMAPIMFLMPVLERPTGAAAALLSLFPFFSPVLMFARAAGGVAPAWQVWLSVALMLATTVGIAWVAGRIYRVGILMAGKRPTLPELWRWVREA